MKSVKTCLKLLLDIRLEELSPNIVHFIIKVIKNHLEKLLLFPFSLKLKICLIKMLDQSKVTVSEDHKSRQKQLKWAKVALDVSKI